MMTKSIKMIAVALAVLIVIMTAGVFAGTMSLRAADEQTAQTEEAAKEGEAEAQGGEAVAAAGTSATGMKALSAALVLALPALAGCLGMGQAISKSADGVARQPEADGSIRTMLMLGLVFIETLVIYALIVAILIIFVM